MCPITHKTLPEKKGRQVLTPKGRKILIWSASVLTVIALIVGACGVYLNSYYRADSDSIAAFSADFAVRGREVADGVIAYEPVDPVAGLIFYPGGLVEYTAYEPLMMACAEKGILCVLLEMPFHLAVLDMNAADGVQAQFPQIEKWYIGGHSLGGAMASSYAAKHADEFDGVVLLGAYSTADITALQVISLYGSEDRVMNREKYDECIPNLPADFTEIVIEGGCHAGFGMYGAQSGDGTPTITESEQIKLTAAAIADWASK